MSKTVMALDIGNNSIGVAVSDPVLCMALPLRTIKRKSKVEDVEELLNIMKEKDVGTVVAGLPLDLYGQIGEQAKIVKTFAKFFYKTTGMKFEFVDERFTTKMANDTLKFLNVKKGKQSGAEDALAASYILEIYLKRNSDKK